MWKRVSDRYITHNSKCKIQKLNCFCDFDQLRMASIKKELYNNSFEDVVSKLEIPERCLLLKSERCVWTVRDSDSKN